MKKITSITLILFLSLLSFPSWSETLTMDDLVKKEDLFYKKFSIFSPLDFLYPFTGKISGYEAGEFYEGKKEGIWEYYNEKGQILNKLNFNEGKEDNLRETFNYYESGKINLKEP